MLTQLVIGVDPGPTPGFVMLSLDGRGGIAAVDVLQCTHRIAPGVFSGLLHGCLGTALVQIEEFVVGRRSGRSSSAHAGALTRQLIGQLQNACATSLTDAAVQLCASGRVKPWATDDRLACAGLIVPTKGMTHARDAARHALFAAVHAGHLPDPLSKEWVR